ncbi:hypothetical protein PUN28_006308 [Cardiocondyla obscurior]
MLIAMNAVTSVIIAFLALTTYGLPSPQIRGGTDALDGAFPYQVSLRTDPADPINTHFCGGAIISERYVITCAHCIEPFREQLDDLYVAVGSNYLDGNNTDIYKVMELIIHAGYNELMHLNDIGLIITFGSINFNSNVQPIALPTADRNYENYPLLVSGWGSLELNEPNANRLQEMIVKGYSHKLCSRVYGNIKNTHLCTFTNINKGMCDGDSGGPLVADGVLVGLMSYSYTACNTGGLDVSTRVISYRPWIEHYTGIL